MKQLQILLFGLILLICGTEAFGQALPKPCRKITREVDVMDGKVQIATPSKMSLFGVRKYIEDGQARTILTLKAVDFKATLKFRLSGATLNINAVGVVVLLEDGTKIERPQAKIDYSIGYGSTWAKSAWITLTDEEIEKLSNTAIQQARLYIYDAKPTTKQAQNLKAQIGCISSME